MITIGNPNRRLGNLMFNHAYARLLALELGYHFNPQPIPGFANTGILLSGRVTSSNPITIADSQRSIPETARLCDGRGVVTLGHFERAEYYLSHQSFFRALFREDHKAQRSGKTVMHIRGKDFTGTMRETPTEFYEAALQELGGPSDVSIVTDDPNSNQVRHFSRQGCRVISGRPLDDFSEIRSAENIVLSLSTFAWWAAFLSSAKRVIQHIPVSGYRSKTDARFNLFNPAWEEIPSEA